MAEVKEIFVELEGSKDLEYKLPNELGRDGKPEKHRKVLTGTDRSGSAARLSVVGIMPTVVHGQSTDGEPHTLAIFEWKVISERPGLRFKDVVIEVSFTAVGARGDAEAEAERLRKVGFKPNYWDPEVVGAAPYDTSWYNRTPHKVSGKTAVEIGFSAGFAPYFSLGPKYTFERNSSVDRTDAVTVVGKGFVVGGGRNRPNSVRWTMLENASQQSGVPAYLRTAVLLKREANDNGVFIGNVTVTTNVSWWANLAEKTRKLTGVVKKDDPVIFDPTEPLTTSFDTMKTKLEQVPLDEEFKLVSLEPLAPPKADAETEAAEKK
jgi:hypothetical protein